MSDDDFDIQRLAVYLHLDAAQVARLADRGNLPGRKVGGQWRFSQASIHHWLEERMGLSSDDELRHMETALSRAPGGDAEEPVSLAAMLPVEAIDTGLAARTRQSVIADMCDLAARTGWLWDPSKMSEAVRAREDMFPTALDNGAALLHPRRPLAALLDRPFLALGLLASGIPFGGPRGAATDVFFLILSVEDQGHLRVLARLSRLLADPGFLVDLRLSADPLAAHDVVARYEARLAG
ncbi:MAG TPA: PTS sugar transporter subunit IIA [Pirellulales bacterium]|nr:PTS sugar transporter subunit IIA [Pirellulales bacterium]